MLRRAGVDRDAPVLPDVKRFALHQRFRTNELGGRRD
jgi:hypothetical protein